MCFYHLMNNTLSGYFEVKEKPGHLTSPHHSFYRGFRATNTQHFLLPYRDSFVSEIAGLTKCHYQQLTVTTTQISHFYVCRQISTQVLNVCVTQYEIGYITTIRL